MSPDPLDRALAELESQLARFFERSARGAGQDLLQETRLRVEKRRASYDPLRPPEPWLWRIAWIVLLEHRRARRRDPAELASEPPARPDLEPARSEARELVWSCVRDLDEGRARARTFVVLHALENVPHARLGQKFQVRESASKMRVLRGLEELEARVTRERFLWPREKSAAAQEAWALVDSLEPRLQHAARLLLFGRVDLTLQRELELGHDASGLDEVALARAHERLVSAGFPRD